jgi:hypothetical protein
MGISARRQRQRGRSRNCPVVFAGMRPDSAISSSLLHYESANAIHPRCAPAGHGKWYLGINYEKPEQIKGHYEFPYGDFKDVHRCGGLLNAESRAGQYQHHDIENATAHLHGMLDDRKAASAPKRPRAASPGKTARGARHSAR